MEKCFDFNNKRVIKMKKKAKKTAKKRRAGMEPLDGYKEIFRTEVKDLKKLSVKEAVKETEKLLKMAELWMRCSKNLSLRSKS